MSEGAGFELDLGAHIGAAVGAAVAEQLAGYRDGERRRLAELNGQIMPLSVDVQPIALAGGNGVLDQPRLNGPAMGWTYQLDGMGAQGFTAGTVGVFINSVQGVQVFNFTSAGVFYQRHFRYLRYGERLVFQAVGVTPSAAQPFGVWISGIAYQDVIQGLVMA